MLCWATDGWPQKTCSFCTRKDKCQCARRQAAQTPCDKPASTLPQQRPRPPQLPLLACASFASSSASWVWSQPSSSLTHPCGSPYPLVIGRLQLLQRPRLPATTRGRLTHLRAWRRRAASSSIVGVGSFAFIAAEDLSFAQAASEADPPEFESLKSEFAEVLAGPRPQNADQSSSCTLKPTRRPCRAADPCGIFRGGDGEGEMEECSHQVEWLLKNGWISQSRLHRSSLHVRQTGPGGSAKIIVG